MHLTKFLIPVSSHVNVFQVGGEGGRQISKKVHVFKPYVVTDDLSDIVSESTDLKKMCWACQPRFHSFRRMMPVAINVKSLPLPSYSPIRASRMSCFLCVKNVKTLFSLDVGQAL